MDGFYPKAVSSDSADEIDEAAVASAIITEIENGEKSKIRICGTVSGTLQKQGLINIKGKIEAVYDKVKAEKDKLTAVSPAKYKTETEFKAALKEESEYASDTTWYTKLKEAKGVSTWEDLKALYEQNETIEGSEPKEIA